MNIQILPNWCKKLGIIIFIAFALPSAMDGVMDGINDGARVYSSPKAQVEVSLDNQLEKIQPNLKTHKISNYFGSELMHLFNILSIIGLIIYMISKEKIEDDYINKLRADSFQISILIFLLFSLTIYSFKGNLNMPLDYFLCFYIILFLFIFSIKKRLY
ncbi:hypothetical protein ACFFVB_03310 [Formosa undariae]|uniref:Uncharacterized protein n=1 Tax=Formosa undariae TaxID=1325436 RepID=A0ABV5EY95_9FLAO